MRYFKLPRRLTIAFLLGALFPNFIIFVLWPFLPSKPAWFRIAFIGPPSLVSDFLGWPIWNLAVWLCVTRGWASQGPCQAFDGPLYRLGQAIYFTFTTIYYGLLFMLISELTYRLKKRFSRPRDP